MGFEQLLPWAIFGGVMCAVWAISTMFSSDSSRATQRLEELRDPSRRQGDDKNGSVESLMEKTAPKLSKALEPKSELEQNKLKIRLANAGYSGPNAAQVFLALKMAVALVGVLIGTGYGAASWGLNKNSLYALVMGGAIGFYLPEIVLALMIRSRKEKIFLSMPDALDLLVVCVEAGLGLDAGMRRVSEELADTAPETCSEFAKANMQLQMGKARREVLHDLGIRTGVDDMRALAAILIQADRFGSSIAQALRVQSDGMRVKRRQMAEEKAQQTAVKMIFPLVLFIFPGIFVILVGPAAIMLINGLLTK